MDSVEVPVVFSVVVPVVEFVVASVVGPPIDSVVCPCVSDAVVEEVESLVLAVVGVVVVLQLINPEQIPSIIHRQRIKEKVFLQFIKTSISVICGH